jgi:hypothetical protein
MEYKLWGNQVTTDWETYLDWLQIQAEYSFTFWLNERVSMEFYKMNFWYYFNTCGITFVNSNIPIGIPIVYGTSGGEDTTNYSEILDNFREYQFKVPFQIWNPDTQWNGKYFIGIDPWYNETEEDSKGVCYVTKRIHDKYENVWRDSRMDD